MATKFTFKITKPEGKYRAFSTAYHEIKLNKVVVGNIIEKEINDRITTIYKVGFVVIKKDPNEDKSPNCPWKWITIKNDFEDLDAAKAILLPTKQQSNISLYIGDLKRCLEISSEPNGSTHIKQHLYIVNDDIIKEGDWMYNSNFKAVAKAANSTLINCGGCFKIIATTDKSLLDYAGDVDYYKQSIHFLSQQFIQLFCRYCQQNRSSG